MVNASKPKNVAETTQFQAAIDLVESLPLDDQAIIIDIIQKRLHQKRRDQLVQTIEAAEAEYAQGNVRRGTVAELMAELDDECS